MDVATLTPYLGMLVFMLLAAWQARIRSGADIGTEAGDFLLRQNEALGRQLADAKRDYRRAEQAYYDLLGWAVRVQQLIAQQAPTLVLPVMPRRAVNGHGQPSPDAPIDKGEIGLRETLSSRLDADDLRTLAYDLGCKTLRDGTVDEMTLALLDYVRTRQKWVELRAWLADNRPDIKE